MNSEVGFCRFLEQEILRWLDLEVKILVLALKTELKGISLILRGRKEECSLGPVEVSCRKSKTGCFEILGRWR